MPSRRADPATGNGAKRVPATLRTRDPDEADRHSIEAAPTGLDPDTIGRALLKQTGVVEIHDLHVWEITSGFPALSAHVLVDATADCHAARRELEHELHEHFKIDHTTLQVDHQGDQLLTIKSLKQ